jgi:hypothetical protein
MIAMIVAALLSAAPGQAPVEAPKSTTTPEQRAAFRVRRKAHCEAMKRCARDPDESACIRKLLATEKT